MNRRFSLGLILILLGIGLLVAGSGAFTAVDADRPISVDVAHDEADALLGLETDVYENATDESNDSLESIETGPTNESEDTTESDDEVADNETTSTDDTTENTTCQLEVTVTNQFSHAIEDVTVETDEGSETFDLEIGESETILYELEDELDEVDVDVTVDDDRVAVHLTRSVAIDECSS